MTRLFILGAGKVGRSLARAARRAEHQVTVRGWRRGLPSKPIDCDLLLLTVRDGQVETAARVLAERRLVPPTSVVAHASGVLGPEVLAPLRAVGTKVAQLHPMISFADARHPPALGGGHALVRGDARAVREVSRFCRSVGLVPRSWREIDPQLYHATAALLANGGCALAAVGAELLERGGAPAADIPKVLGPLLRSVADNIEALGLPEALTGPVRRGGVGTIQAHLEALRTEAPEHLDLYRAVARAQLPLATKLQDAADSDLATIARLLRRTKARTADK